jgi:hypothetical protein
MEDLVEVAITIESQYDERSISIDITSKSDQLIGKYSIFHQRAGGFDQP